MGRPKCFSRTEVMEKAIPVFWKHGFAGTSVQDLEKATSVNKSGLYSEFKDKEDLFLSSLKHYVSQTAAFDVLGKEPQGWGNIETFLKMGQTCSGQKGCFIVNTLRELSDLPLSAKQVMAQHVARLKAAIVDNIRAAGGRIPPAALADMIMTFHSGLSVQQNYGVAANINAERIETFLTAVRG